MIHRIVSSRLLVKAHPVHIYKFLENLDNHKTLWPATSGWEGDKDQARYQWQLGLGRFNVETRIVERFPGLRICEEPVSGSPFSYRRYFKIQADDQTAILNIAVEAQMSRLQMALYHLAMKAQLEGILKNIQTQMEKPKSAPAASASPVAVAAAPPPAATPVLSPTSSTPPTAASS
ncbi:MAG: hypothetical protein SGI90_00260 [Candidatus Eisenbacteria bacterium]|nr:hypothetical protein [Candidatus Eisenbacteria bacterium]